jgi:hypothetical protein
VSDCRLAELDELIEELTVDAYGDEEQLIGFLTGAETHSKRQSRQASSVCR